AARNAACRAAKAPATASLPRPPYGWRHQVGFSWEARFKKAVGAGWAKCCYAFEQGCIMCLRLTSNRVAWLDLYRLTGTNSSVMPRRIASGGAAQGGTLSGTA